MTIEYENLDIELSRCCCGEREIRIQDSPVDRPREPLRISDSDLQKLQTNIDRFDQLLLKRGDSYQAEARELATTIGTQLFHILTPGTIGSSLREALMFLDDERQIRDVGRRLRFSFGQSENYDSVLAAPPWELICDPRGGGRFLGCEPQTQVVRLLNISRRVKPLAVEPPLKVLAVLASPKDQPRIDLAQQELRLHRETNTPEKTLELHVLGPPILQGSSVLGPPTLTALKHILTEHEAEGRPFHVLHFLGHGELMDDGDGALYLERDDRSQHIVRSHVLARQISALRNLRLVVLATCSGAKLPRRNGQNPFTGCASAMIAANIPAVVAMQFNISEQAAAAFTSAFYSRLAAMHPLDEAVADGRLAISAADVDGCEWATPVLFLQSPDGRIFRSKSAKEVSDRESHETGDYYTKVRLEDDDITAGKDVKVTVRESPQRGKSSTPHRAELDVSRTKVQAGNDVIFTGTSEK